MDGPASLAQFYAPVDVCDDGLGNIFVADQQNYRVRMINTTSMNVSTYAGTGVAGSRLGNRTQSQFNLLNAIIYDHTKNIFIIADSNPNLKLIINSQVSLLNSLNAICSKISVENGIVYCADSLSRSILSITDCKRGKKKDEQNFFFFLQNH